MGSLTAKRWSHRAILCFAGLVVFLALFIRAIWIDSEQWPGFWISGFGLINMALLSLICWDIAQLDPSDSHTLLSLILQYLLLRVGYLIGLSVARRLHKATSSLSAQQQTYLLKLLDSNSQTKYGTDHKFSEMKSVAEFRKRHPITSYSHYDDYIRRVGDGEKNVLTKSDVLYFYSTSGTTGNSKIVPICKESTKDGRTIFLLSLYIPYYKGAKANLQKQFFLYVKPKLKEAKCGLKIGLGTSFIFRHSPLLISPKEVFDIKNELVSMYVHGLFLLLEPEVGTMTFFYAMQTYNFFKYLEKQWGNLCDDIENGIITIDPGLEDTDVIGNINVTLNPNKARADFLRSVISKESGTVGLAKKIWPGLTKCMVTSTGAMAIYAKHLRETFLKDVPLISWFYGATEGYYGVSLTDDVYDTTYTLGFAFGFLEFLPIENINEGEDIGNKVLLPHQVKENHFYEIITTNTSGLCRYRSGDIVKVTSFMNECPIIEYSDRNGQILNLTGERTPESVMYHAISTTVQRLGVSLIDYTTCEDIYMRDMPGFVAIAPTREERCYVIFLELDRKLSTEEKEKFDKVLCEESSSYKWVRTNKQVVTDIMVVQVKPGSFCQLEQDMRTDSSNYQQFKLPRVLRNKQYLGKLLKDILA